jgi:hypothetical protein
MLHHTRFHTMGRLYFCWYNSIKGTWHEKIYGSFNPGGTDRNCFLLFHLQLSNLFKKGKRAAFSGIKNIIIAKNKAAIRRLFHFLKDFIICF